MLTDVLAPPEPSAISRHPDGARKAGRRVVWVDAVRGAALCGMLVFHAAWDLHAYGIVDTDPNSAGLWRVFGRVVAGLFLALSGLGLALADRQGTPLPLILRRLGRIALAATAVTAVTWWVAPEAPIWFGILHCIVVTNAIALTLRRWRPWGILLLAAAAMLAPFAGTLPLGPVWAWTGMTGSEPATLDFRPVLPWLGVVLVGLVYGRSIAAAGAARRHGSGTVALAWLGRHSLAIYLLHQPVLIAILAITVGSRPPPLATPKDAAAFLQACRTECSAQGGEDQVCRSTCHCVLTTVLAETASKAVAWSLVPRAPVPGLAPAVAACRGSTPRPWR